MGLLSWLGFNKQRAKRLDVDQILCSLIGEAEAFGLPAQDVYNVREMLQHAEYAIAFDTLVQQLYEHDVPITEQYYQQSLAVAEALSLPVEESIFTKNLLELLRPNS